MGKTLNKKRLAFILGSGALMVLLPYSIGLLIVFLSLHTLPPDTTVMNYWALGAIVFLVFMLCGVAVVGCGLVIKELVNYVWTKSK